MSLPADPSLPPAIPQISDNDPALPPPLPETTNLDPLTGEPGAHPVGVGIGAAATGVVGAALGAIAGPVGVVAGTAAGALAGGYLGKGAAEVVNPTHEGVAETTDAPPAVAAEAPVVAHDAPTAPMSKIALPQSTTIVARTSYPEGNVRVAAYYRYLHRREEGAPGDEIADWVEAEKQVLRVD